MFELFLIIFSALLAFLVYVFVLIQGSKMKAKRLKVESLNIQQEKPILGFGTCAGVCFFIIFWAVYLTLESNSKLESNNNVKTNSEVAEINQEKNLDFIEFQKIVNKKRNETPKNAFLNFKFGMTKIEFENEYRKLKSRMTEYGPGIFTYKVQFDKNTTVYEMAITPYYYKGLLYKLSLTAYADFNTTQLLNGYFKDKYGAEPFNLLLGNSAFGRIWIDGNKFVMLTTVNDNYSKELTPLKYGQIEYYDCMKFIEKTITDRGIAVRDSLKRSEAEVNRIKETSEIL